MAKYGQIIVQVSRRRGNSLAIIGAVMNALKRAGVGRDEINAYFEQATSGNYGDVIRVTEEWVNVA